MTNDDQFTLFEEPVPDLYPVSFLEPSTRDLELAAVEIDGLKGFDYSMVELAPLSVLTGPNNSGKSTILQAVALGFECFRRCLDTDRWELRDTGRAVTEFDFLPVNQPKDLWYEQVWKPSREEERQIRVGLHFTNGFQLTFQIRFLFGFLNMKLADADPQPDEDLLRAMVSASPLLLPASPGPSPHEDYVTDASVHQILSIREPMRVIRNVLMRLQREDEHEETRQFVESVLKRYFDTEIQEIDFDERRDLEIRAPIKEEEDYALDIVSSGSGLNQILQLAATIAWRRPGIVLLDEPDAHLHTSVQAQLYDFLTALVENYGVQVILATHSRDLISQAPLEAIVPVDRGREHLTPLESLEHLLLEFQRHGQVSNIDLALLYQTRRCIFVEGSTDSRLLPRIAEKLDIPMFRGDTQAVLFEFGGVDKLTYLPELVDLFEQLVGAGLTWGVIRDSDAHLPRVKEIHRRQGEALDGSFHQWDRYSLENYLIEPSIVAAAVRKRIGEDGPDLDEEAIVELLEEAVDRMEDDVSGPFITKAQTAYREHELAENPFNAGAREASRYLRELESLEDKLRAFPGKKIFGGLVQLLQERHGVNLRLDDLAGALDRENAPDELVETLERMAEDVTPVEAGG